MAVINNKNVSLCGTIRFEEVENNFVVNFSLVGDPEGEPYYTCDKTPNEIVKAYEAGKTIYAVDEYDVIYILKAKPTIYEIEFVNSDINEFEDDEYGQKIIVISLIDTSVHSTGDWVIKHSETSCENWTFTLEDESTVVKRVVILL